MSKRITHTLEPIPTRVAHAGWEDHRHFGWSVFRDLAGYETYTGLLVLAVTGRRVSEETCRIIDETAGVFAVCDPRIYPLKIVRLVSSYGRILPALAAGTVYMEDTIIGPWTARMAAEFLVNLRSEIGYRFDDRDALQLCLSEQLVKGRHIAGFGVPFREVDERIVALRKLIERRKRNRLPYWRLFEASAEIFRKERGINPNIGGGIAASFLDLGFSADEIPILATALSQNSLLANAIEGSKQAPEVLRCLPEDCIEYVGEPPRRSPRAIEKERQ